MKAKSIFKNFVLSAALLVVSLATSARSYDNQLIYNPIEENGMTVGQTVYKMDGNTLANYMKYNYKYDDNKRMIESEALKWNNSKGRMGKKTYASITRMKARPLLPIIINGTLKNKPTYWYPK